MPTFTMTKNWDDNQTLTESMLDDIKNSTETFLNVTKLDGDNIQDSAIVPGKIAANAVTTAKILDANVTRAKLEAVGQVFSSSSGNFTTTATSFTAVTNLSAAAVTVAAGRGALIFLQPDGTTATATAGSLFHGTTSGTSGTTFFRLKRDSDVIAMWAMNQSATGTSRNITIPSTPVYHDQPSAGTYTYSIEAQSDALGATTFGFFYLKLVAVPL